jgi:hypothetical protein
MAKSSNVPRQINSVNPSFTKTYRYNTSSGSSLITTDSLLYAAGGVAATTTSLFPIVGSFKILSIKMWAPCVNNALVSCSVEWVGGLFSPTKKITETSNSVTTPARLRTTPPEGSASSFWQGIGENNSLFTISSDVSNTIVDVVLQCILNDNSLSLIAKTVVAATVGNIYYLGLDGLPVATSKYIPIGVPTGV